MGYNLFVFNSHNFNYANRYCRNSQYRDANSNPAVHYISEAFHFKKER